MFDSSNKQYNNIKHGNTYCCWVWSQIRDRRYWSLLCLALTCCLSRPILRMDCPCDLHQQFLSIVFYLFTDSEKGLKPRWFNQSNCQVRLTTPSFDQLICRPGVSPVGATCPRAPPLQITSGAENRPVLWTHENSLLLLWSRFMVQHRTTK